MTNGPTEAKQRNPGDGSITRLGNGGFWALSPVMAIVKRKGL